jgi:hypothetical protein
MHKGHDDLASSALITCCCNSTLRLRVAYNLTPLRTRSFVLSFCSNLTSRLCSDTITGLIVLCETFGGQLSLSPSLSLPLSLCLILLILFRYSFLENDENHENFLRSRDQNLVVPSKCSLKSTAATLDCLVIRTCAPTPPGV